MKLIKLSTNAIGLITTLGIASLLPNMALAAPMNNTGYTAMNQSLNYGILNFSASASRKVDNDLITANLSKIIQNKSSAEVASQIAKTTNQAIVIAKKYPQVKLSSGNQSTYPQYDKNQKIIAWTGTANLNLKSTDSVAISQLIAELQSFMTMEGINFSVSDELRKKVNQELMIEASTAFQQQAKALLPTWQARDYQLVNLEFNQGGDYGRYPVPVVMMAKAQNADTIAEQNFQAGESTITVTANGSVQLIK